MMNRWVALMLVIALLCGVVAADSLADVNGAYKYTVKDDGTAEIFSADTNLKDADIPAELDGYKVTSIAEGAFRQCAKLQSVTIPEGVTSIGPVAFSMCMKLKKASLPEGLKTIGNRAFGSCTSLETVNIPDSVDNIGEAAFSSCWKLASIQISPDHPAYAFNNKALIDTRDMTLISCHVIKPEDYEIGWGIRTIASSAFTGSKCKTVTIPGSVTVIRPFAFMICESLKEVYIPNSVKEIGSQQFYYCTKLTKINIPDSATEIGDGMFAWCSALKTVEISPDHPAYEVVDGMMIDKASKTLMSVLPTKAGTCEIPAGIKKIAASAFQGCKKLKEIMIPDSVTEIEGIRVFKECSKNLVCKGPEGSCAQKYCEENGIKFAVQQ